MVHNAYGVMVPHWAMVSQVLWCRIDLMCMVPHWAKVIVFSSLWKEMSCWRFEPRSTGQEPSVLTTWPSRLECLSSIINGYVPVQLSSYSQVSFVRIQREASLMILFEFASIWNWGSYSYLLFQWIPLACSGALPKLRCSFYEFVHAVENSKMSAPIDTVVA